MASAAGVTLNCTNKRFQARNSFYLKISDGCVLMMKILIDPIHLNWFNQDNQSSIILLKLEEILKPRILSKILIEQNSNNKKSKLEIYRGSGFQFGYYFRNQAFHHTILLKSKELIHPIKFESPEKDDSNIVIKSDPEDESFKPPSSLKVHYQPFSIFGKLLIVIIEPFPLPNYNEDSLETHESKTSPTTLSLVEEQSKLSENDSSTSTRPRPLFLPEDDDDGDSEINNNNLNQGIQSHRSLLSKLIKNPNPDRNLDHKSQSRSLTLDNFLSRQPPETGLNTEKVKSKYF
ncbi:hypothetical protein O181_071301 [Austropuccinia psidii MF-1]|uniref:Uncharacterized protein n=1 Tax=Austropuccinia psidii MF-1 TaxID=1389203 RepID=A0A9Q3F0G5_9BASI|nr:hypothetical protein [Austropuccinia psidii MF-1]